MHLLVERLTDEFKCPLLKEISEVQAFVSRPGSHVLFLGGGERANLETLDVAVILPELAAAFGGQFDVGVVADEIDRTVRETEDKYAVPNLFFYRDGQFLDELPKVRDWDEYLERIQSIMAKEPEKEISHVG